MTFYAIEWWIDIDTFPWIIQITVNETNELKDAHFCITTKIASIQKTNSEKATIECKMWRIWVSVGCIDYIRFHDFGDLVFSSRIAWRQSI